MANTHLIFLVHGMGDFAPGWSRSAQQVLQDQYATYKQLKQISFGKRFEFVEILYNDEFEALRTMWRDMNKALGDALVGLGGGQVGKTDEDLKVVRKLNEAAGVTSKDRFLTTHVVDVLLYYAARQTAATVRESVRKQIFTALKKQVADGGVVRWSVIAHSLGTAVTHDALHEAFSDEPTEFGEKLAGIAPATCVEWDIDVYLSRTRPGNPDDPDAACHTFINAHNTFDPFTQPKAFRPAAQWPSIGVRAQGLFQDIETREIEAPEKVHDFDHYLRNPAVHAPLFNAMLGMKVLDDLTISDAHAQYVTHTPLGSFGAFVGALKQFQLGEEDSWAKVFSTWANFRAMLPKDLPL